MKTFLANRGSVFEGSFTTAGRFRIWAALGFVALFSLLALAPSNVQLNAPKMSLGEYLTQVNWLGLVTDGESLVGLLILFGLLALVTAYSVVRSAYVRIGLLLAVLLVLALLYRSLALLVLSPYLAIAGTWKMLFGREGGQFYRDGGLFMTAFGWWILLTWVLLGRECWLIRKRKQSAQ